MLSSSLDFTTDSRRKISAYGLCTSCTRKIHRKEIVCAWRTRVCILSLTHCFLFPLSLSAATIQKITFHLGADFWFGLIEDKAR